MSAELFELAVRLRPLTDEDIRLTCLQIAATTIMSEQRDEERPRGISADQIVGCASVLVDFVKGKAASY